MTPDEIEQRMTELDAELATKLRAMGFSETEVARVLDNEIPAEQRDAEIKDILAREFIRHANEPSEAPRKRRWPIVVALLAVAAAVGVAIYLLVPRQKPNACIAELGRIERLGALRMAKPIDGEYCSVWFSDAKGDTKVSLRNSIGEDYRMMKQVIEERRYASHETFTSGRHAVDFYVAGSARWTQQQLQDDIVHRVGRSHDPTGDALQAMPPAEHVALVAHDGIVTELQLDADMFPAAKAKQLVTAIVGDWR